MHRVTLKKQNSLLLLQKYMGSVFFGGGTLYYVYNEQFTKIMYINNPNLLLK